MYYIWGHRDGNHVLLTRDMKYVFSLFFFQFYEALLVARTHNYSLQRKYYYNIIGVIALGYKFSQTKVHSFEE